MSIKLTIDGVEKEYTEVVSPGDTSHKKILDFFNILAILHVLEDDNCFFIDSLDQDLIKYPKDNCDPRITQLVNFKEAIDFCTKQGTFHSRLSTDFYCKAKKILDTLQCKYTIYLANKKNSPVLFKIEEQPWGILVAPRLISNIDETSPIGYTEEKE